MGSQPSRYGSKKEPGHLSEIHHTDGDGVIQVGASTRTKGPALVSSANPYGVQRNRDSLYGILGKIQITQDEDEI